MSTIQQYETAIRLFRIAFPEAAEYMDGPGRELKLTTSILDNQSGFIWSSSDQEHNYWKKKYDFICDETGKFLSERDLCKKLGYGRKLEKFSLEKYIAGKTEVCTIYNDVRILCMDRKGSEFVIVGLVLMGEIEGVKYWNLKGDCFDLAEDSALYIKTNILIKKGWVNVYPENIDTNLLDNGRRYISEIYTTRKQADKFASKNRISCLEVKCEDTI